jgi:antitoxin component YwqK of YwqJK toxin-antitoxin module
MTLLGYKKCKPINNHIIRLVGVFEIPEDAIICPNPIDKLKTARFRVNKCKLIRVEELNGDEANYNEIESVSFTSHDPFIKFKLNEETFIEEKDMEINENYFGKGILMFLDKRRAQNYLLEYLEEGELAIYRDNGILYSIKSFHKTRKHGFCKLYHSNGIIKKESEYYFGILCGIQYFYNENGNLIKKIDHTPKIIDYSLTRYT